MECSCCGTEFQKKNIKKRIAIHSKFKCGPSAAEYAFICTEWIILASKTQITPTHRRIAKKAKVIISTPRKVCQPKLMSRKSLREKMYTQHKKPNIKNGVSRVRGN
ncbi:hypothetical protein ACJMK2_008013 [Sinanodonta woodiana]|uniref:Uncharacterized protein n=1 Tax=Sinanodonta woodiana TaxID=1069815 RepID=A0ABD3VLU4_SINWO